MRCLYVLIALIFSFSSQIGVAQNLVPNGSFEEGIVCPTQNSNVTIECESWYASILNSDGPNPTPDWYHTCSELDNLSPPELSVGYQLPLDGGGYVGFYAYHLVAENVREVVGVELVQPLIIGESYLIEFYANNIAPPDVAISSNNLGFNFSTHPFYNFDEFPINSSHFAVEEMMPANDEWNYFAHVFVADSAYQYLHFGNFFDDENTTVDMNIPNPHSTYYIIDDVSVSSVLSDQLKESTSQNELELFPVPTGNKLNVRLPDENWIERVEIFSLTGEQQYFEEKNAHFRLLNLDVSELSPGAYIVQIQTQSSVFRKVFLKQ